MENIKQGMYVRCPIDSEDVFNPRLFALGQIHGIDHEFKEVVVIFHDLNGLHKNYPDIREKRVFSMDQIEHCKILCSSEVKLLKLNKSAEILRFSGMVNGYNEYYVRYFENGISRVMLVNEANIIAQFNSDDPEPTTQMKNFELQNPIWYVNRSVVSDSLHTLKNATYGFETLIGSRVYLLPHQVDTIVRAVREPECRFMLADEVGLGKTIEASVIMQGLRSRFGKLRTLMIIPGSLAQQWKNELFYKFWMDVDVWNPSRKLGSIVDTLIVPLEKVATPEFKHILDMDWNLCVVDETHRLLHLSNEYKSILELSKKVRHILLLTATPIQQRQTEYLKLLTLLLPERYENLSEESFEKLLEKQRILRRYVHRMVKDLEYYYEDELFEDYMEKLVEIAEKIEDPVFNRIIKNVDMDSEDQGLDQIKIALAYISRYYQIEKNIIRHRRKELIDKFAKRSFVTNFYTPAGANFNFYELDVYESLIEYLETLLTTSNQKSVFIGAYVQLFLSAFFSSPYALLSILKIRKSLVENDSTARVAATAESTGQDDLDIFRYFQLINEKKERENIISNITPISEEIEKITDLYMLAEKWSNAVKNEFIRLDDLYDDPSLIQGRLTKVIDYVSENSLGRKLVLFTSWPETLKKLENVMIKRFGTDKVASFYKGKSESELQLAADQFQSNPECQFLLCDELGGEGRNFQIADEIIHIDLPWSPMKLEQRIGRLDRIGREINKEVKSIIFIAKDTIEEDLFNLWKDGLNIFSESISGIEIAIEDIYREILEALSSDLRFGLKESFKRIVEHTEKMRELIDEERYYDIARQLDIRIEKQLNALIEKFDQGGGQNLFNTMMAWSALTGFRAEMLDPIKKIVLFRPTGVSWGSMKNTLFELPDMKNSRRHLSSKQEIRGTFSREVAIRRENLIFFAPGDSFFDAIVNNAQGCARGRCTAFAQRADFDWQGFVFTWSVDIDIKPLLELGEDIINLIFAKGYLPVNQIITYESLSKRHEDIDEELIRRELEKKYLPSEFKKNVAHLGKREQGKDFLGLHVNNYDFFRSETDPQKWTEIINSRAEISRNKAIRRVKELIDLRQVKSDFKQHLSALRAANLYYEKDGDLQVEEERLDNIFRALYNGLREPEIILDSLAFVWMVNTDGKD